MAKTEVFDINRDFHRAWPRRRVLGGIAAAAAGALMPGCATNAETPAAQLERNKTVVMRFKKAQGTPEQDAAMREVLAPDYKRLRGGMENLANNARDQGYPGTGQFLRAAIPDRVDVYEDIIAEGDRVGLRWRLTGTHRGNLFGIPPTGRKIDVYEVGLFRLAGGKIVEAWFMVDEAGLLKQLGARLPSRKDGKQIAPPITDAGETGDAALAKLKARPAQTQETATA